MTDRDALALTIWGEARGEPIEGKIGVACVVRNRVNSRYRGAASYVDVCTARLQFSAWVDEAKAMQSEEVLLLDEHPDPTLALCVEIANAVIADILPDITKGANHYYAASIAPPAWAAGQFTLITLGHQRFYSVS